MGFWSIVGKVASKGYNVAKADLEKKASSYNMLFGKINESTFFKLNALVFETICTDIRNPCARFCILF